MTIKYVKATKHQSKARIAIDGPAGAGKTYTALIAATVLADGGKIAVIDTERGSASLYSDKFDFDVVELETFDPKLYVEAINLAESEGYAVIVVDSLSHAWEGEGGVLELHEQATKRQRTENSYTAWRDVTPVHRKLVDTLLQSKCHVIATMRSKMEYSQEKDGNGKTIIKKIGLAPVQRQGTEYEFTIVADMDTDHNLVVSKSRCEFMADLVETKPTSKFFEPLRDWLKSGDTPVEKPKKEPEPEIRMVTLWDGKTQAPAESKVDPDNAAKFAKPMIQKLGHANHVKNYIHKHFGVEISDEMTVPSVIVKLTWEQMIALHEQVANYKPEDPKKEVPKDEPVVTKVVEKTAELVDVEGVGVDLDALSRELTKTAGMTYKALSDADKEIVKSVLSSGLIGTVIEKSDIATIASLCQEEKRGKK